MKRISEYKTAACIDLQIEIQAVPFAQLSQMQPGEPSANIRARAYNRILKVARTIADLAGSDDVTETHVLEASTWRELDRTYWA